MNADRVIRQLRDLDARSGGQRLAWTKVWQSERESFAHELAAEVDDAQVSRDAAGNLWIILAGNSAEKVVLGSHTDCVPNGGWLDGCLGVFAAAEVLRCYRDRTPERTIAIVDWADEEGARFGYSLFGSRAAVGRLNLDDVRGLSDKDGVSLPDALSNCGVVLDDLGDMSAQLESAVACLELHIEQGPVLDQAGISAAAVAGCLGIRRHRFDFIGRAGHAGATPLPMRQDPVVAACNAVASWTDAASAVEGLATVGRLQANPGTATAVSSDVTLVLDLRHGDIDQLDQLERDAFETAKATAEKYNCTFKSTPAWSIDPIQFDQRIVQRASEILSDSPALTSGPLHDCAALCVAGIPTGMVFARTHGGVSHSREEDARDEDLAVAIKAYGDVAHDLIAGKLV